MTRLRTPSPCVIDTNVPLVANGVGDAGKDCVDSCVRAVHDTVRSGHIVIDDGWRIIGEYKNKLNSGGQPGVGDAFLKWILTNFSNPNRCTQVEILPVDDDPEDFLEFPDQLRKIGFDRSDRKFVAVAAGHTKTPPILQATDSKWWGWRKDLLREGVTVQFLCEEEIRRRFKKKTGRRRGSGK